MIRKITFLLIFLLLIVGLNTNQSLWLDEATSVLTARNLTVSQIINNFSIKDFHPPFYYLLLHFWIALGQGDASEIFVRLPSVFFTLATAYLIYLFARKFTSFKWSIFAAVLYGTGPLVFYYSAEARMYALASFLVTLSFYAIFNLFEKWSLKSWFILIASLTLLLYADYMPYLVLPIFLTPIFSRSLSTSHKRKLLIGFLLSILLFLPWLPYLFRQLQAGLSVQGSSPGWSAILGSFNLKSLPLLWVKLIIGRISFVPKIVYAGIVGLASVVYALPLVASWQNITLKKNKFERNTLFLWLIFPPFVGLLISLRLSIFQYFRFLYLAPVFYLLVALGAKRFGRLFAISLLLFNLLFVGYYLASPQFYREDWRSMSTYIKENLREPSVALFPNRGQADPYIYYGQPAPVVSRTNWLFQNPRQVWLFRYVQEIFDPGDSIRHKLESSGYRKIEEKANNQVLVWRYEKL